METTSGNRTDRMRLLRRLSLVVLALFVPAALLGACGDDDGDSSEGTTSSSTTSTTAASAAPAVSDAWARQVQDRGAVYLVIKGGSESDALVRASVPADVAGTVELHETVGAMDEGADDGGMDDGGADEGGMEDGATTTVPGSSGMDDGADDGAMDDGATTTAPGSSGMMQMRPVERIEVPAGATVELKPGGLHIMLLDVKRTLTPGETIEVTLEFEKAGTQSVTAEVRET